MNNSTKKQLIELAIKENKLLKFDYVDNSFEITSGRIVEPKELNDFILLAHDIAKNGLRQFHFDGIQKLEVIEKETHANTNE